MDEAPIVALRAVNYQRRVTGDNGESWLETWRYELQFRRSGSEIWETVQAFDKEE